MQGTRMMPTAKKPIKVAVSRIQAGHPAEIQPDLEDFDLHYLITKGREDFVLFEVEGDSGLPEIAPGDWIAVDPSRRNDARTGDMVACYIDGAVCVKRLDHTPRRLRLVSPNTSYDPIEVNEYNDFNIIGVVVAAVSLIGNVIQIRNPEPELSISKIEPQDGMIFVELKDAHGRPTRFMMEASEVAKAIGMATIAVAKRLTK